MERNITYALIVGVAVGAAVAASSGSIGIGIGVGVAIAIAMSRIWTKRNQQGGDGPSQG